MDPSADKKSLSWLDMPIKINPNDEPFSEDDEDIFNFTEEELLKYNFSNITRGRNSCADNAVKYDDDVVPVDSLDVDKIKLTNNSNDSTIADLPSEMILKIFSYLSPRDLIKASKVCKEFNAVSKDATIWNAIDRPIRIQNSAKLASFCRFFRGIPNIRVLSLIFDCDKFRHGFTKFETTELNCLFKALQNLECMNIDHGDLSSLYLPPSLKHFSCNLESNVYKHDALKLPPLKNMPDDLQHLGLRLQWGDYFQLLSLRRYKLKYLIKQYLYKYKSSLTSFHLVVDEFHEEWITFIANCSNLKSLKVVSGNMPDRIYRLYVDRVMNLPHLEEFAINNGKLTSLLSLIFDKGGFQKLRCLSLRRCSDFEKIALNRMLSYFPKLETFILSQPLQLDQKCLILEYIKDCKSLKNIVFGVSGSGDNVNDFLDGISEVHKKRQFENVCYCALKTSQFPMNCKGKSFGNVVQGKRCIFTSFSYKCFSCCSTKKCNWNSKDTSAEISSAILAFKHSNTVNLFDGMSETKRNMWVI